jgi:hypothetical protein
LTWYRVLAMMPADDLARTLEPIAHTTLYGGPPSPPGQRARIAGLSSPAAYGRCLPISHPAVESCSQPEEVLGVAVGDLLPVGRAERRVPEKCSGLCVIGKGIVDREQHAVGAEDHQGT